MLWDFRPSFAAEVYKNRWPEPLILCRRCSWHWQQRPSSLNCRYVGFAIDAGKYPLDHCRVFNTGNYLHRALAVTTHLDLNIEDPLEVLRLGHGSALLPVTLVIEYLGDGGGTILVLTALATLAGRDGCPLRDLRHLIAPLHELAYYLNLEIFWVPRSCSTFSIH
jgi:hypothetical protein